MMFIEDLQCSCSNVGLKHQEYITNIRNNENILTITEIMEQYHRIQLMHNIDKQNTSLR
jgi:hypothetical protein